MTADPFPRWPDEWLDEHDLAKAASQWETIVLREHNCPYATVVSEHPECCTVIHSMLDEVISPEVKQTESLATGGAECRFEVASGATHS